jgi:hypothetical protein
MLLLQPGCCRRAGSEAGTVYTRRARGWSSVGVRSSRRRRLTLGKSRGWCSRRGSSVFPQSKEKEDYRKEWKNGGKSLLSGTAQGASEAWKGPVVVGRCVGNAGGGTRKVCGWQGQKSLRRITACRWSGKSKIEKGVTGSRVVRASSAWPCRILRQRERVKLAAACHISISPRTRVVWFRDAGWLPDQLSRPRPDSLHSPLPQHRDGRCRAAQNEGRWTQSAWLLAQGMLGFQWLKARVQSAEAQQVAGAVDFCDGRIWRIGIGQELGAADSKAAAGQGMTLAGARAWGRCFLQAKKSGFSRLAIDLCRYQQSNSDGR